MVGPRVHLRGVAGWALLLWWLRHGAPSIDVHPGKGPPPRRSANIRNARPVPKSRAKAQRPRDRTRPTMATPPRPPARLPRPPARLGCLTNAASTSPYSTSASWSGDRQPGAPPVTRRDLRRAACHVPPGNHTPGNHNATRQTMSCARSSKMAGVPYRRRGNRAAVAGHLRLEGKRARRRGEAKGLWPPAEVTMPGPRCATSSAAGRRVSRRRKRAGATTGRASQPLVVGLLEAAPPRTSTAPRLFAPGSHRVMIATPRRRTGRPAGPRGWTWTRGSPRIASADLEVSEVGTP
jgi:hypothetical protein